MNTKNTLASRLKKPESKIKKPETKLASPSNTKFGLKNVAKNSNKPSPDTAGKSIRRPSTKSGLKSPSERSPGGQGNKDTTPSASKQKELEQKKKLDQEARERKRKMMEERKLLLKKKLSAIKIQKFWKARCRRRNMKLQMIRYKAAIRTLQKFFKQIYLVHKAKKQVLEECKKNHMSKILRIQRNYRNFKTCPKKINVPKFKAKLLATIIGWKVRRALAILKSNQQIMEAMDVIKMHEDTKKQENNLFFKQLLEKFPEMVELFHSKLNEILESKTWPEKPVVKKKVLVSYI